LRGILARGAREPRNPMEQAGSDRMRDNQLVSYSWAAEPLEALQKDRRPAPVKRERKDL
jgi:hypothetical protein